MITMLFNNGKRLLGHVRCENEEQFKRFLEMVLNDGGEGVVMRQPRTLYKRERTAEFLKFKVHSFIRSFFYGYYFISYLCLIVLVGKPR